MNKYQEALEELAMYAGTSDMVDVDEYRFVVEYESRLQELVDKAKSLQPKDKKCPSCGESHWLQRYCAMCGQKLDWSEDE